MSIERDFARLEAGEGFADTPANRTPTAQERLAAHSAPAPLLDFTSIEPERPTVRIDGQDHAISFFDDFTLAQHARFARLQARANELGALSVDAESDTLTEQQAEALSDAMDDAYYQMARLILPSCPPATLERLSYQKRVMVVTAFNVAVAQRNATQGGTAAAVAPPTGARSSPPAPRATAGGSATGSRKRRSATSSPPTAP